MRSTKDEIKRRLVACLGVAKEVRKIVIFGSFLTHPAPHDVDIAVFQDSDEEYLPLAMKYRRLARPVAQEIPLDIIPVRMDAGNGTFWDEIDKGESIYER